MASHVLIRGFEDTLEHLPINVGMNRYKAYKITEEVLLIPSRIWIFLRTSSSLFPPAVAPAFKVKPTADWDYNLFLLLTIKMTKISWCLYNRRTDHQRLSLFDLCLITTKQKYLCYCTFWMRVGQSSWQCLQLSDTKLHKKWLTPSSFFSCVSNSMNLKFTNKLTHTLTDT